MTTVRKLQLVILCLCAVKSIANQCVEGEPCPDPSCFLCVVKDRCRRLWPFSTSWFCIPEVPLTIPPPNYDRPYNRNSFLTTHNSFAHTNTWPFFSANQARTLNQQLEDGVRGFMLDVHTHQGVAYLCHGSCTNIAKSHTSSLISLESAFTLFRNHLSNNRREVITLFLESYVRDSVVDSALENSGLMQYLYPKRRWPGIGQEWPPLNNMTPAVVMFGSRDWDYMKETMYGRTDGDRCEHRPESRDRGSSSRNLLLVNHFSLFKLFNTYPNLWHKLSTCHTTMGQWANFLAVDFYDSNDRFGGAKMAVKWLNSKW